jgi:hypothetical protein
MRKGLALSFAGAVACLALTLTGCASTRTAGDDGVVRSGGAAFRIGPAAPSWRRIDVDDASLAYRDEPHRASVLLNARCGEKDGDVPLKALTAQLVMGTTDRAIASEDTLPFDGREALHTRLQAKLDGVPMAYDLYVLKKDGCVYDFVYVGEPGVMDAGAPDFERFVTGFHTAGATP